MTKKKGTTQKSSQSKSQPDLTRPLSKWRIKELHAFAQEHGIELKKGTVKEMQEQIESLNKRGEIKLPNEGKRGGAREGAGRKPNTELERMKILRENAENHALEETIVVIKEGTTIKEVKMTRDLALLDVLFTEGMKRKNITAIKEYFDRTRGKSRQPVEHSGEIKTEDQYIPDDPATMKAYETYKKERKKLIAQGYYGE